MRICSFRISRVFDAIHTCCWFPFFPLPLTRTRPGSACRSLGADARALWRHGRLSNAVVLWRAHTRLSRRRLQGTLQCSSNAAWCGVGWIESRGSELFSRRKIIVAQLFRINYCILRHPNTRMQTNSGRAHSDLNRPQLFSTRYHSLPVLLIPGAHTPTLIILLLIRPRWSATTRIRSPPTLPRTAAAVVLTPSRPTLRKSVATPRPARARPRKRHRSPRPRPRPRRQLVAAMVTRWMIPCSPRGRHSRRPRPSRRRRRRRRRVSRPRHRYHTWWWWSETSRQ
jgi:hypothetical protein